MNARAACAGLAALWIFSAGLLSARAAEPSADALIEGFRSPPPETRPRVWWHWMNGNVTEDGARLDLEWMKRVGIGGLHQFDGDFWGVGKDDSTPDIVAKPIVFMSPDWWRVFRSSVVLASEAGLEFGIASCPGWTTTGAPWVSPEDAMKKLVWSETWVKGGRPFTGHLKAPPDTTGPFQDIPVSPLDEHWKARPPLHFYRDIATIAYRAPATERPLAALHPVVTSSAGPIDGARLYDGELAQSVPLSFGNSREAWIQIGFGDVQAIRAFSLVVDRPDAHPLQFPLPHGRLEASNDGQRFRKVLELPQTGVIELSSLQQTISFSPVSARFFRLILERPDDKKDDHDFTYRVSEWVLHTGPRVNRFEDKAGFSTRQIVPADDTPPADSRQVIHLSDIIDLTRQTQADGSVHWTPPLGRWVVLRFGYSLTGKLNDPAPPAATGLEVDKLDRNAVKHYLDVYFSQYEAALGPSLMGRRGVTALMVDSYEAGPQNWTTRMLDEFKARLGYDLRPWMPVLIGRIVESSIASDRVLWDFRKSLGELMRDAHYEELTAAAHEHGLIRYGESHEWGRFLIGDGMEMKKSADIPMGAMWMGLPEWAIPNYEADLRESASTAHLYGRRYAAAESFASDVNPYGFSPENLKPVADRIMTEGINRFVIHTSVHQPDSRPGPGLGLGAVGQWFTRHESWAEMAKPWTDYLARSSYLLEQGRFVADIALLYGEGINLTSRFHSSTPEVPPGYSYDFVNADALLNELSAKNGRLVSRSGTQYSVLMLDSSTERMTLPVLRKIAELARAGVTIAGEPPRVTPSLRDNERDFTALVREFWPKAGAPPATVHRSVTEALAAAHIAPDVRIPPEAPLRFVHRKLDGGGELYFVANLSDRSRRVTASFRVSGRQPEVWRADKATIQPSSYRLENGRTSVPLDLDPHDAIFILFRKPTREQSVEIPQPTRTLLTTLAGPWEVAFPPHLGAPPHVRFEQLASWTDQAEPGIRYFSGTASYSRHFEISPDWLQGGGRVEINLGRVKNLAEVRINGRSIGVLWKAPFRAEITEALNGGENALEVQVTNLWPNRLIGDQQPGAHIIGYAAYDPFKADSPLPPSGLLGPVTIWQVTGSASP